MTDKTEHDLMWYVRRTEEVDESGDASFVSYLEEESDVVYVIGETRRQELIHAYLAWANGKNWKEFLDGAEVGDIPPLPAK